MINSKRKSNLIETDGGKDFYNNIFQDFLDKNNLKIFARSTSLGAVFAERFNRTKKDPPKRPVLKKFKAIGLEYYPQ